MKIARWMVLSLLACLAFGCADASDEELADGTSDDSAPVDVTSPDADPCANADEDGDGVSTVSGCDMSTPEAALACYARLREACSLDVQIHRRGKVETITYEIE